MTVNPRTKTMKTPKTRSRLSRTNEITDSRAGIATNHKVQANAVTKTTPELETTATGTGNTAFIAKSRITLRKNAGRE
jgi:hypothetical protein